MKRAISKSRVADPAGFYPDPNPTFKKKTGSATLEKITEINPQIQPRSKFWLKKIHLFLFSFHIKVNILWSLILQMKFDFEGLCILMFGPDPTKFCEPDPIIF